MSEDAGDEEFGEGELAQPDWRMRAGKSKQTDAARDGKTTKQRTCRSETGAQIVWWAEDAPITISPKKKKERGSIEKTDNCDG